MKRGHFLSLILLTLLPIPTFGMLASFNQALLASRCMPRLLSASLKNPRVPSRLHSSASCSIIHELSFHQVAEKNDQTIKALGTKGLAPYARLYPFSRALIIRNLIGNIHVQGWDKDHVSITSTKESNDEQAMTNTQIVTNSILNTIPRLQPQTITCKTQLVEDPEKACQQIENRDTRIFSSFYYKNGIPHIDGKPVAAVHYIVKTPYHTEVTTSTLHGNITLRNISHVGAVCEKGNIEIEDCGHIKYSISRKSEAETILT